MPKSKVLQVRITEDEQLLLKSTAEKTNMTISGLIRSRIFTEDEIFEERIIELTKLVQTYAAQLKQLKVLRDEEYIMLKKLLAVLIVHEADTEDIFTELEEIRIERECMNVQSLVGKYRERGTWT